MTLKRIFSIYASAILCTALHADTRFDLTGNWKVIDDKSGFTLVEVKITQTSPRIYAGHIIKAFSPPNLPDKDLSSMTGFQLLYDLKQDHQHLFTLSSGQVIDPILQQRYSIRGKLSPNGNTMILRNPSDAERQSRKLSWVRLHH